MKKLFLLPLFILAFGLNYSNAQAEMTEGYIKMELTDIHSDNPEVAQGLEMMKGGTMESYFTAEKSLTVVNMMQGMVATKTLFDNDTKESLMLMDMMGNKIQVKGKAEDFTNEETEKIKENIKINEFRSETKKISGYDCHKIEIIIDEANDMTMTAYVTEQIKTSAKNLQGLEQVNMKGFPLEFKIVMGGMMSMTYTAVIVEPKVNHKVFNLNAEGYKEMTMDEFQKMAGGMSGGMGF